MGQIRYTAYSYNPPSIPLSRNEFENIKAMGTNEFKEYVSAISSHAWKKFREEQQFRVQLIIYGGLGGGIVAYLFRNIDVICGIAILVSILCVFPIYSLLLSSVSYLQYVEQQKVFFRKRRKIVVLSKTYEEYCSLDKKK